MLPADHRELLPVLRELLEQEARIDNDTFRSRQHGRLRRRSTCAAVEGMRSILEEIARTLIKPSTVGYFHLTAS